MGLRRRAGKRGFTLVEMMYTLGISGILGAGFLGATLWQERLYQRRLSDADTRQQAETVINVLRLAADRVGYGYGQATDAAGVVPLGVCNNTASYPTTWWQGTPAAACASLDNGGKNDRVRFGFMDNWQLSYLAPTVPSAGPCSTFDTVDATSIHFAESAYTASQTSGQLHFQSGVPLVIGGSCQGGGTPSAATDIVQLTTSPAVGTCYEVRTYQRLAPSGATNQLSCPSGYAAGFTLGIAEALEFYTDVDPLSGLSRLMMAQLAWQQTPAQVAVGVTRFEVRYGFDLSATPDYKLDLCPTCTDDPWQGQYGGPYSWCREVRAADQGGTCKLSDTSGNVLSTAALRSRVIALNVTFDIVSPQASGAVTKALGLPSGAPKWTYQATFNLPNLN